MIVSQRHKQDNVTLAERGERLRLAVVYLLTFILHEDLFKVVSSPNLQPILVVCAVEATIFYHQ